MNTHLEARIRAAIPDRYTVSIAVHADQWVITAIDADDPDGSAALEVPMAESDDQIILLVTGWISHPVPTEMRAR